MNLLPARRLFLLRRRHFPFTELRRGCLLRIGKAVAVHTAFEAQTTFEVQTDVTVQMELEAARVGA